MTEGAERTDGSRAPQEWDGAHVAGITLGAAAGAWGTVALQTFGGPAGQIAVMHREIVEERRWVGEDRFLHALSYCTMLPGPEAQQLATYLGWLLNGTAGGIIAGALFVLPGYIAIMVLSLMYAGFGDTTVVDAVFAGVAPAVLAIVAQAVRRISGRALVNPFLIAIAVGSFLALALFAVPFPFVVLGGALVGFVGGRIRPGLFASRIQTATIETVGRAQANSAPLIPDTALVHATPSATRTARTFVVCAVAWVTPVVLLAVLFGSSSIFVTQARFFGTSALVTFGGAYAVLSYVAQKAVNTYQWLLPGEMIKGLAMAETTPGPLIQVVQFVAFLGAYRNPGTLNPWVAAVIASTLVTWVTYVPSFFFVFVGAPYVERLRGDRRVTDALSAITAVVVGVIANLAVYFAIHTLFAEVGKRSLGPLRFDLPTWSTFSPAAGFVSTLAFVLVFRFKWSVLRVLGVCAVHGGGIHMLAG